MKDTKSVHTKIPLESYTQLKIIAALQDRSISSCIADAVIHWTLQQKQFGKQVIDMSKKVQRKARSPE